MSPMIAIEYLNSFKVVRVLFYMVKKYYADVETTTRYIGVAKDWNHRRGSRFHDDGKGNFLENGEDGFVGCTKAFLSGADVNYLNIRTINALCNRDDEKQGKLLDLINHIYHENQDRTLFKDSLNE